MPALAVADILRERGFEVSFAGAEGRIEADLVPRAGYEIDLLRLSGIDRRNPFKAVRAVGQAMSALPAANRLVARRAPDVVIGGGGFAAGPVALAGRRSGRPLVLTEADRHLGLANRLLWRRADALCLAFPIPGVEGPVVEVTGRPVDLEILEVSRSTARERFSIPPETRCLLVVGGSLGALSINRTAIEAFGSASERDFSVIHVTGSRDFEMARDLLGSVDDPEGYVLLEYERNLGDCLAACDLVLARSGGSVFELAATGRPSILVPFPHAAGDHQRANAEWMAEAGAAVVVDDGSLEAASLRRTVRGLFGDDDRLESMSRAALGLARPDAAERIASRVARLAEVER